MYYESRQSSFLRTLPTLCFWEFAKLETFPFAAYGLIHGEELYLSRDAVTLGEKHNVYIATTCLEHNFVQVEGRRFLFLRKCRLLWKLKFVSTDLFFTFNHSYLSLLVKA